MPFSRRLALALTLCSLWSLCSSAVARDTWRNVDRIVAIGDLHGDYDQFIGVLKMSSLIDDDGMWAAGRTHLVQTGDVPDRGPDTMRILEHLWQLKRQASEARGHVHLLVGNHEAMNITGDLRYVHPGEYAALTDKNSTLRRENYFRHYMSAVATQDPNLVVDDAFIAAWKERFPLGYVEHRLTWEPGGTTSKQIAKQNTVIKLNDILFLHGGINPHSEFKSIRRINRAVKRALSSTDPAEQAIVDDLDGPLWYRGYADHDASTESGPLAVMLDKYDADHVVVGHSPSRGFIRTRFDGAVVLIDVGLASAYGAGLASLLIEDDEWFALHRGQRIPLPHHRSEQLSYLQSLKSLEPNPAPLQKAIDELREAQAESAVH